MADPQAPTLVTKAQANNVSEARETGRSLLMVWKCLRNFIIFILLYKKTVIMLASKFPSYTDLRRVSGQRFLAQPT